MNANAPLLADEFPRVATRFCPVSDTEVPFASSVPAVMTAALFSVIELPLTRSRTTAPERFTAPAMVSGPAVGEPISSVSAVTFEPVGRLPPPPIVIGAPRVYGVRSTVPPTAIREPFGPKLRELSAMMIVLPVPPAVTAPPMDNATASESAKLPVVVKAPRVEIELPCESAALVALPVSVLTSISPELCVSAPEMARSAVPATSVPVSANGPVSARLNAPVPVVKLPSATIVLLPVSNAAPALPDRVPALIEPVVSLSVPFPVRFTFAPLTGPASA